MTDRIKYRSLEYGKKSIRQRTRNSLLEPDRIATLNCEACKRDILERERERLLPATRIPRLKTSYESTQSNKKRDTSEKQIKRSQEVAPPTAARVKSNSKQDTVTTGVDEKRSNQENPARVVSQRLNAFEIKKCSYVDTKESDLIQQRISSIFAQAKSNTTQVKTSSIIINSDSKFTQGEAPPVVIESNEPKEKSLSIVRCGKPVALDSNKPKEKSFSIVSCGKPILFEPNEPKEKSLSIVSCGKPVALDLNKPKEKSLSIVSCGKPILFEPNEPKEKSLSIVSCGKLVVLDSNKPKEKSLSIVSCGKPILFEPNEPKEKSITIVSCGKPVDLDLNKPIEKSLSIVSSGKPILFEPNEPKEKSITIVSCGKSVVFEPNKQKEKSITILSCGKSVVLESNEPKEKSLSIVGCGKPMVLESNEPKGKSVSYGKLNKPSKKTLSNIISKELRVSKEKKSLSFAFRQPDTSQVTTSSVTSTTTAEDIFSHIIARAQSRVSTESLIQAVTELASLDEKALSSSPLNKSNTRMAKPKSIINVAKSNSIKDYISNVVQSNPSNPETYEENMKVKNDPIEPEPKPDQPPRICRKDYPCQQDSQSVPQKKSNHLPGGVSIVSMHLSQESKRILEKCPTDGPCNMLQDSATVLSPITLVKSLSHGLICPSEHPSNMSQNPIQDDAICRTDSLGKISQQSILNMSQNAITKSPTCGAMSPLDSPTQSSTSLRKMLLTHACVSSSQDGCAENGSAQSPGTCNLQNKVPLLIDLTDASGVMLNASSYHKQKTLTDSGGCPGSFIKPNAIRSLTSQVKVTKTVSTECPDLIGLPIKCPSKCEQTDFPIAGQLNMTGKQRSRSRWTKTNVPDPSCGQNSKRTRKRSLFRKCRKSDMECSGRCMLPSDLESGPFPMLCNAIRAALQCFTNPNQKRNKREERLRARRERRKKIARPKYKKVKGKKTRANANFRTIARNGRANCCACCGLISNYVKEICNILCLRHICDSRISKILNDMRVVAGCICNDCYVFIKRLCGCLVKKI